MDKIDYETLSKSTASERFSLLIRSFGLVPFIVISLVIVAVPILISMYITKVTNEAVTAAAHERNLSDYEFAMGERFDKIILSLEGVRESLDRGNINRAQVKDSIQLIEKAVGELSLDVRDYLIPLP
jgi:hypothetical protein